MTEPLRSARLSYRPLGGEHAPQIKALFGDPGVRAIYGEGRDADDRVARWIAWSQAQRAQGAVGFWALGCASAPFVGMCGILRQTVDDETDLEVGYLLRDAYTGCGYATEAAAFATDYAFAHFDISRVVSIIRCDNVRSMRVAERNGFVVARATRYADMDVRIYATSRASWSLRHGVDEDAIDRDDRTRRDDVRR